MFFILSLKLRAQCAGHRKKMHRAQGAELRAQSSGQKEKVWLKIKFKVIN